MGDEIIGPRMELARRVAREYERLPEVLAVVLSGSAMSGAADELSDIDMYVYVSDAPAVSERERIATEKASRAEVDNRFFELGEEWMDKESGIHVDASFRWPDWIGEQIEQRLVRHEGAIGYSTAFLYNLRNSRALFDRDGWYAELQRRVDVPYPEELRRAIIAKNYPLLGPNISSFSVQIKKAVMRNDAVSVNHRVAALLASYFDILFALNRQYHPGEKRLITLAQRLCPKRPEKMAEQVGAVLAASGGVDKELPGHVEALIAGLDKSLAEEGLLPEYKPYRAPTG